MLEVGVGLSYHTLSRVTIVVDFYCIEVCFRGFIHGNPNF